MGALDYKLDADKRAFAGQLAAGSYAQTRLYEIISRKHAASELSTASC